MACCKDSWRTWESGTGLHVSLLVFVEEPTHETEDLGVGLSSLQLIGEPEVESGDHSVPRLKGHHTCMLPYMPDLRNPKVKTLMPQSLDSASLNLKPLNPLTLKLSTPANPKPYIGPRLCSMTSGTLLLLGGSQPTVKTTMSQPFLGSLTSFLTSSWVREW